MHCPQCHADNPDQAISCLECGMPLALTCSRCGTELPPQSNFCFHCGDPVTVPAAEPDENTLALLQMWHNDELDVFFPEILSRVEINRARLK